MIEGLRYLDYELKMLNYTLRHARIWNQKDILEFFINIFGDNMLYLNVFVIESNNNSKTTMNTSNSC